MSSKSLAEVQKCIDETVTLLSIYVAARRLTVLERNQITRLVTELQDCSRTLPELGKKRSGLKPVFDLIEKIIDCLFLRK
jgi:hypothetical protein